MPIPAYTVRTIARVAPPPPAVPFFLLVFVLLTYCYTVTVPIRNQTLQEFHKISSIKKMDSDLQTSYPYVELSTQRKAEIPSSATPTPPALLPPAQHQLLLGPENTVATCPFCYASIKTAVKYTNNTRTHIAAALCCAFMCCCIPYCSESAKNADHYCPNCDRYLGTYHK